MPGRRPDAPDTHFIADFITHFMRMPRKQLALVVAVSAGLVLDLGTLCPSCPQLAWTGSCPGGRPSACPAAALPCGREIAGRCAVPARGGDASADEACAPRRGSCCGGGPIDRPDPVADDGPDPDPEPTPPCRIPLCCLLLCLDACVEQTNPWADGPPPPTVPGPSPVRLAAWLPMPVPDRAAWRHPPSRGSPARPLQPVLCVWRH